MSSPGLARSRPSGGTVTWAIALTCLLLIAIACLWYPVARITSYAQLNYNEGWNSYRQQMAANGEMLYALPPDYSVTNYPPFSFHLIGFLGKLVGDMTAAGRWVSVFSLVLVALGIAALARHFTGLWRLGAYAAISFVTWLSIFMPDRIGMNDPQLLGLACSVLGLWLYVRGLESDRWLIASALAFAVSLFIKQNLLAFPAAVGIHLLVLGTRRRLAVWVGSLALAGGLFLFLTLQWDGPYFWTHLTVSRYYSFLDGWKAQIPHFLLFQLPFFIALFWSIWIARTSPRNVLSIAFWLSLLAAFYFAGGDGVDRNVFFDGLTLAALLTTLAIGDIAPFVTRLKGGRILLPALLALPALAPALLLPIVLDQQQRIWKLLPQMESEATQAVEFLKSRPGPALCENLLLCYEAAKPPIFDAFFVHDQELIRRIPHTEVLEALTSLRFRTIQIDRLPGEPLQATPRVRFSYDFMRVLLERYRPVMQAATFVIFVPKDER